MDMIEPDPRIVASLSFQNGSQFISTKPVEDRSEKDSKCNGADLGGA